MAKQRRADKYLIGAYRNGAHLPHTVWRAKNVLERGIKVREAHAEFPKDLIQVRLLYGFRHEYPIRWAAIKDEKTCQLDLEPTVWYDKNANGKRSFVDRKKGDWPLLCKEESE